MHSQRPRHVPQLGLTDVLTIALAVGMTACSAGAGESDATWRLAPETELTAETRSVEILVSRAECNSGVTGTVNEPTVEFRDDQVIITATVSPGSPQVADCQGNDEVPYAVELPRALGERALIDGGCDRGREAVGTVFCETAVRGSP